MCLEGSAEDSFREHKSQFKDAEFREIAVAFSNSLPENRKGEIYIKLGKDNPDSLQKTIAEICQRKCYPPIQDYECEVLDSQEGRLLKITISPSKNRPHFAGPAYIRAGSQNINASRDQFEDLIASRSEKPREILKWKGKAITVHSLGKRLGDTEVLGASFRAGYECRVETCGSHRLTLLDLGTNERLSEPLSYIEVSWDDRKNRLELIVQRR